MRFPEETIERVENLREQVRAVIVNIVSECEEFNDYNSYTDGKLLNVSDSAVNDLRSLLGTEGLILHGNVGDTRIIARPEYEFISAFGFDSEKFVGLNVSPFDGFIRTFALLGDRDKAERFQRCYSALKFEPYGMRGISAFGGLISVYAPLSASEKVVYDMFMYSSDASYCTYRPNGSKAVADLVEAVRQLVGLE